MRAVLLVPVLMLASACGGNTAPPPGMGSIELGTANLDGSGFLPLTGMQTMVAGAQGGFHVWLKYRVTGMAPATVTVDRTVRRVSDGKLVLKATGDQALGEPDADGTWELPTALPSFMCPAPLGVQVQSEEMAFDLIITDANGTQLGEGTAQATPLCPDGDEASFCQKICNG